ncbi:ribonuclease Z [Flavobacterium salilacus subsp. salilacus]|uniref:ribonuclease Z n=1 Tax=Flavobacterium TaxID=237 RepID=UPI001075346C|nr:MULTISPECIES: ribonuclease Z [Flavobacterium]KAF2518570.1 ribonuclease Z [Flavobacterium salilacus subsp. salilacus]MBE1613526.1 ribonuclease Z [Flavobacterium sp. SaA2.13]
MKVEEKGHTVSIKDTQGDIPAFLEKVTSGYNSFNNFNIIIDLTQYDTLALQQVLSFLTLSNQHRKAKKSFVIVVNDFDFNEAPDEMTIVPTVLEAQDIIEMEEIERDLGF